MKRLMIATAVMAALANCGKSAPDSNKMKEPIVERVIEGPGVMDVLDWKRVNQAISDWAGHGPGSMEFDYLNLISADKEACGTRWFKQQPSREFPERLSRFSDGLRQGKFYSPDILSRFRTMWQGYRDAWELHLTSLQGDRVSCLQLIRDHLKTCNNTAARADSLDNIFFDFYRTHASASSKQIPPQLFFGN